LHFGEDMQMVKTFWNAVVPMTIMLGILSGFMILNGMFWGGML